MIAKKVKQNLELSSNKTAITANTRNEIVDEKNAQVAPPITNQMRNETNNCPLASMAMVFATKRTTFYSDDLDYRFLEKPIRMIVFDLVATE